MSLTVIIPIKDEEKVIKNTLNSFNNSWIRNINHEILFINDYCQDSTVNIIKNSQFDSSKQFVCIFMADMSDSIEDLKTYYENINNDENLDAIFGSRFIKNSNIKNYPKFKLLVNRLANNIIRLIFFSKYNDFTNAFKIYRKNTLLKLYPLVSENFNIFLELPLKIECRQYKYKIVPITWSGRNFGVSKFSLKELGSKYIFTMLYCLLEKILLKK